jgi:5-methylcytosine-specific restriction endonuclease McrA
VRVLVVPTANGRALGYRPGWKVKWWQAIRQYVLKRDLCTCQHCGYTPAWMPVDLTKHHYVDYRAQTLQVIEIDHIIPLSKGGTHEPDNLQVLCNRCNASKATK